MNPSLAPTTAAERVAVIDVLRGFAIFGVLVVNMFYFFNPFGAPQITPDSTAADHAAHFIINFLFVSKFYTLFSFLFGLGMYIQMSRAQAKNARFVPLYLRRLMFLALFGFAHGVLLWIGDILLTYAVTGVLLVLLFRNCKPRTLLVWAIILIAIPIAFMGVGTASIELARMAPPEMGVMEEIDAEFAEVAREAEADASRDYDIYANGGFAAITAERFNDYVELLLTVGWFSTPSVLAMFLLGVRAGKRGWFTQIDDHITTFRNLLFWALPLGLAMNLYVALTGFNQSMLGIEVLTWQTFFQVAALGIGSVLLCVSYIAIIVLLSRTTLGARILSPLAPVGRMALSNYLLHSIVMTTLACGYGFGLYGSIGLATGLLLAIVLYALQIPLSNWWMRHYRFGPFEWVWRTLTYGRLQPLRKMERQTA